MTESAERPWGTYTVLAQGQGFKVKTIEVRPGQRLSYQKHGRRAEHWFVVAGAGVVTLDGTAVGISNGDAIGIPPGTAHRIHRTGPSRWCSSKSRPASISAKTTSSAWTTTMDDHNQTRPPQASLTCGPDRLRLALTSAAVPGNSAGLV